MWPHQPLAVNTNLLIQSAGIVKGYLVTLTVEDKSIFPFSTDQLFDSVTGSGGKGISASILIHKTGQAQTLLVETDKILKTNLPLFFKSKQQQYAELISCAEDGLGDVIYKYNLCMCVQTK